MKRIILIIFGLILLNLNLSASWSSWQKAVDETVKYVHAQQSNRTKSEDSKYSNKQDTTYNINLRNNSLLVKQLFNKENCQLILKNQIVTTCYDTDYKSATMVAYKIHGKTVHEVNLKKRGNWKYNKDIPKNKRSNNKDYVKTGYDKGHLAPDSAFDFNKRVLQNTYDLNINAVPMAANTNRKTWIKSEKYSKKMAYELGYINVIDMIIFSNNPKTMGRNKISIADGFVKILYNKKQNFQKCFYYENDKNPDLKSDKLKNHIIDCNEVI